MKRTKIVCTLGPASNSEKILSQMIKAGLNVARLNFSHGTYPEHKKLISLIRKLSKKFDQPITVLQDLQGPRIRVGVLPERGIALKAGQEIILTTDSKIKIGKVFKDEILIPVTYGKMHLDVKKGERILLADGLFELIILGVKGKQIKCIVKNGGLLTSHKGINLPQTDLKIPAITEKDKKDLAFGLKNNVDMVAMSFARTPEDVLKIKKIIKKLELKHQGKKVLPTQVIVKIEKREAIANFNKILEVADGVMVARGDLGIEMPMANVPVEQKEIIEKCLKAAKPVIVATQMLDSMIRNPQPTRAEVSDVANAVIDHADAVMLSGESAEGKYPVAAVAMMAKIIFRTERSKYDNLSNFNNFFANRLKTAEAFASDAEILAQKIKAKAILVVSNKPNASRFVSRFRPELPILVAALNEKNRCQLNLSWGVSPFVLPKQKNIEQAIKKALAYIKKNKFVKARDLIVIVADFETKNDRDINWLKIQQIS